MFEGQPKGLYALALANTGERFGYYTMLAIFVLFLMDNFGMSPSTAGNIYAMFLALVYFLPFIGGILADKFGYGRMVTVGVCTTCLADGKQHIGAGGNVCRTGRNQLRYGTFQRKPAGDGRQPLR